jgi:predicted  nucleic acid-binding Zn-ribbon protein
VKKLDAQKLAKLPKSAIARAEVKLSAIAAVLQAAPAVLTHARLGGQPMEVLLNGPVAAGRAAEPLVAMVRGAGGKVVEQARLKGVPVLAALTGGAIATTAAAVGVRLSVDGLEGRLNELLKDLNEVRSTAATEHKTVIAEAATHLRDDVLKTVQHGHLSPVLVSDLEQMDQSLAEVQEHLVAQHKRLNQLSKALRCKGEFDPDEFFKLLSEHVRRLDSTRKQYVLTLKARLVCWQFLSLFPQDGEAHEARRNVLAEATLAPELGTAYEPVVQAIVTQIDTLDDSLSDDKTLAHRKAGMQVYAQNAFENTRQDLDDIRQALDKAAATAAAQLAARGKPTRLAVRVDKGKLEAFELKDLVEADAAAAAAPGATAAATA